MSITAIRCVLWTIRFLAHIVSDDGIECDLVTTVADTSLPVQLNVTELQRFVRFDRYYRRSVADLVRKAQPPYALLGGRSKKKSRGGTSVSSVGVG